MISLNLVIRRKFAGLRFDKFLRKIYPEYSRYEIQRAIKEGVILINGAPVKQSYLLKEGDNIVGILKKLADVYLRPNSAVPIQLIFEDENLMAINKPSGYPVYPSKHHEHDTIANGLLARFPYLKKEFYGSIRLGIVHRLDKETSGLLLIAKNRDSFYNISKLFEKRLVKKTYLALVYGNLKKKKDCFKASLVRSFADWRKRIVVSRVDDIASAKQAITCYKVIASYKDFDLVEVFPKTGRMHQIRVHFLYLNHPILGDRLYKKEENKSLVEVSRLMLHAHRISFRYKGKYYNIEAPIPDDFKKFLDAPVVQRIEQGSPKA